MRLGTLIKYHLSSMKYAIPIFYLFFMIGTLFGETINILASDSVSDTNSNLPDNLSEQPGNVYIFAFIVFMVVISLVIAQKDTRFLITRSVSRKEIFVSILLHLVPVAAIMSVLQIVSIYIVGLIRMLSGNAFVGIKLDIQTLQAPNMSNMLVFFAVSFSFMLAFSAIGYLLGSLLARWKIQTIGVMIILPLIFIALFALPGFITQLSKILKFMFLDDTNGLFIALKQLLLAAGVFILTFPIMRRITAAKQA